MFFYLLKLFACDSNDPDETFTVVENVKVKLAFNNKGSIRAHNRLPSKFIGHLMH